MRRVIHTFYIYQTKTKNFKNVEKNKFVHNI